MATIQTIGKAQLFGAALKQITGVEPSYIYEDNFVRVYFEPDRLKQVQSKLEQMAASGPSDVRIDWFPIVSPIAIKKAVPFALGILAAGYLLGKIK